MDFWKISGFDHAWLNLSKWNKRCFYNCHIVFFMREEFCWEDKGSDYKLHLHLHAQTQPRQTHVCSLGSNTSRRRRALGSSHFISLSHSITQTDRGVSNHQLHWRQNFFRLAKFNAHIRMKECCHLKKCFLHSTFYCTTTNGRGSAINRALDGSTYPGKRANAFFYLQKIKKVVWNTSTYTRD